MRVVVAVVLTLVRVASPRAAPVLLPLVWLAVARLAMLRPLNAALLQLQRVVVACADAVVRRPLRMAAAVVVPVVRVAAARAAVVAVALVRMAAARAGTVVLQFVRVAPPVLLVVVFVPVARAAAALLLLLQVPAVLVLLVFRVAAAVLLLLLREVAAALLLLLRLAAAVLLQLLWVATARAAAGVLRLVRVVIVPQARPAATIVLSLVPMSAGLATRGGLRCCVSSSSASGSSRCCSWGGSRLRACPSRAPLRGFCSWCAWSSAPGMHVSLVRLTAARAAAVLLPQVHLMIARAMASGYCRWSACTETASGSWGRCARGCCGWRSCAPPSGCRCRGLSGVLRRGTC